MMLVPCAASHRKGHLEAVFHIFAHPKGHAHFKLVFDSSFPNNIDLTDFCKDIKKQIPKEAAERIPWVKLLR